MCAKKLLLQSEENLISSFTDDGVSSSERDNADGIHTAKLHFFGATLQLRGINPLVQPLVDASGNFLVYNGILCYFLTLGFFFFFESF